MSQEYVTYKGIQSVSDCNVRKMLELQQWILDPDSRPYDIEDRGLIARSASMKVEEQKKSNVQKQLELQQMVLGQL